MNDLLIFSNSTNPGNIMHHAAFHLGLHYLPKYLDRGVASLKFKVHTCVTGEMHAKRNIYKQRRGWDATKCSVSVMFAKVTHTLGNGRL